MKKRIEELDIIKAICITGIVFAHAGHSLGWIGYFYVYGFYFVPVSLGATNLFQVF